MIFKNPSSRISCSKRNCYDNHNSASTENINRNQHEKILEKYDFLWFGNNSSYYSLMFCSFGSDMWTWKYSSTSMASLYHKLKQTIIYWNKTGNQNHLMSCPMKMPIPFTENFQCWKDHITLEQNVLYCRSNTYQGVTGSLYICLPGCEGSN
jgi:hypothetical protein